MNSKIDANISRDIKEIKDPGQRIIIRGLILLLITVTGALGYAWIKIDRLYNRIDEIRNECTKNRIEAVEVERQRTYQAKKESDSIHAADQRELREFYADRTRSLEKQSIKIKKELR